MTAPTTIVAAAGISHRITNDTHEDHEAASDARTVSGAAVLTGWAGWGANVVCARRFATKAGVSDLSR
jgi:hypothetical protein